MTTALSRVVFSTGKDDWRTPRALFDQLRAEFHFTLDAAANATNALCDFYYGPGSLILEDATAQAWPCGDVIWCNPPYSRGLQAKFIERAAQCGRRGGTVVMLLPARTDTKAFHEHIYNRERWRARDGVEIRFLKGRLRFEGAPAGAPFPSMIVIFRGD